ncbi:MAG: hypothetical protein DWQ35_05325 [Planctomycetota bacterium]|nr:MAG: hypothetical protein DWQ35_05325 [Planctomycetota bacterium]
MSKKLMMVAVSLGLALVAVPDSVEANGNLYRRYLRKCGIHCGRGYHAQIAHRYQVVTQRRGNWQSALADPYGFFTPSEMIAPGEPWAPPPELHRPQDEPPQAYRSPATHHGHVAPYGGRAGDGPALSLGQPDVGLPGWQPHRRAEQISFPVETSPAFR